MKLTLFRLFICCVVILAFAQADVWSIESDHVVHLIYLVPNDREAQPDIDTTFDASIKMTQQFFADEIARHGFGRKTFKVETGENGNAIVHHIDGKHNDAYYQNDPFNKILDELQGRFDFTNNICVIAVEISGGTFVGACGIAGNNENGGYVFVPASGACRENVALIPHELGHAFGLQHNFLNAADIMSYGAVREDLSSKQLSLCNAQWLSVHPYFNSDRVITRNENTRIDPLLAEYDVEPPHAFRLRFELNDPDGLHQAQLIVTKGAALNDSTEPEFVDCQMLNGVNDVAEFPTTRNLEFVMIQVIDKEGNYTRQFYEVDATVPPPRTDTASIPDPNLAAAIREALGMLPAQQITTFDLVRLSSLTAANRDITDLTGLEHAVRIESLNLSANQIQDITQVSKLTQLTDLRIGANQIRDLTPLVNLTQLKVLDLFANRIRDITPLAHLTKLTSLSLGSPFLFDGSDGQFKVQPGYNEISDITPLANLTQLKDLFLTGIQISDITPLANLTQLRWLSLGHNQIRDITPLKNLTNIINLVLQHNQIQDISPLKGLIRLWRLYIDNNPLSDDLTGLKDMTLMRHLQISNSPNITDITPLSRMAQLEELSVRGTKISDITPLTALTKLKSLTLANNQISDITPLSGMTQLYELGLWQNQIQDILPIAMLTNLERLSLSYNQISDIRPVSRLTQLKSLGLVDNQISDVRPLLSLVNLKGLSVWGNPIEDREPLLTLLRRNPGITIYHQKNGEPLPVSLSSFKAVRTAEGAVLNWITESEVDNAGFYIYRSQTKDGEYTVVNPKLIHGAGTTGERNEYTWTDTTAKPNTVYYYRIEDVSHAGVREQLATVRLRGLVSAAGKHFTSWGDIKVSR